MGCPKSMARAIKGTWNKWLSLCYKTLEHKARKLGKNSSLHICRELRQRCQPDLPDKSRIDKFKRKPKTEAACKGTYDGTETTFLNLAFYLD
jgi:hypothetical protein